MDNSEMLFCEYYAAAQSLKSSWTRLASTYGCMMIILTSNTLIIRPHWFAKWLLSVLRLDLYHEISITGIKDVIEIGNWHSYGKVEVRFQSVEGIEQKILLYMKQSFDFVDKMESAMH